MSYDIDVIQEILEEIVDGIDQDLFEGLNGGIILKEEIKYHNESINNDLVVLGEYTRFGVLKQILIYYGSIKNQYPDFDREQLKDRLTELVNHELRHHIEYRAGVNDLVREDDEFISKHKEKRGDL